MNDILIISNQENMIKRLQPCFPNDCEIHIVDPFIAKIKEYFHDRKIRLIIFDIENILLIHVEKILECFSVELIGYVPFMLMGSNEDCQACTPYLPREPLINITTPHSIQDIKDKMDLVFPSRFKKHILVVDDTGLILRTIKTMQIGRAHV